MAMFHCYVSSPEGRGFMVSRIHLEATGDGGFGWILAPAEPPNTEDPETSAAPWESDSVTSSAAERHNLKICAIFMVVSWWFNGR